MLRQAQHEDYDPHMSAEQPLLQVEDLSVGFATEEGRITVVEDVSFTVAAGRTVGLVGESGCGKSVTAMSIMRLQPSPPSHIDGGRILFEGTDLLALPESAMRGVRGDRIGMIFQEPMTSLNPTLSIGFQIGEVLRLHRGMTGAAAREKSIEILRLVGVGAVERRVDQYPHQLSGGLRQRVMIAMALVCNPRLLIADEPTTALDVTIQAQILELLRRLQRELGMAILLITHDLGIVAEFCDEVVVMYAGRVVERSGVRPLFASPRHPYTAGLLAAMPRLTKRGGRLVTIPGMVPPPAARGAGCSFADRCPRVLPRCRAERPPLVPHAPGHDAACWNPPP
ncbi:ABC transporter ATP-binding protein [Virgifigura deserti]|uniref:ABC transporter ATP-binding protein n=1 Tax=Virgifigura deserti TaxID=2268457 RepID=UPI003CCBD527